MAASSKKAARMLQLAREIVELENALALRKKEFIRLSGEDAQLELPGPPRLAAPLVEQLRDPPRPSLARTMPSLPNRILALLDMNPRPLSVPEIAMLLEEGGAVDTIRATLSKLVQRTMIRRVGHGLYQSLASAPERSGTGGT